MKDLFFARDGSASAFATVQTYALGYLGVVRFAVDTKTGSALRHECVRYRGTRQQALEDARADAQTLVTRWVEDRVHIDDLDGF